MSDINDGGPAFPCAEDHKVASEILWTQGMSKRELFAAILMHSEAVTCGVPGEACEALVAASAAAGADVIDHMAMNAVHGADALLRALAEPRAPEPRYRDLTPMEEDELRIGRDARVALEAAKADPAFEQLAPALRQRIQSVIHAFLDNEVPF